MFRHACAMGLEGIVSERRNDLARNEEAAMGFKLDPREIGWAPA